MRAILVGMMLVVGCGGGGGEPIEGTVTIDWGDDHVVPTVGAAVEDTDTPDVENMQIYIGTRDIDCGTSFDSRINPGTYVYFSVDRTAPGEHTPQISVIRVESGEGHFNSSGGMVTIDMIGDRVTGDFMVETTDDDAGTIVAGGTFDVIRCF